MLYRSLGALVVGVLVSLATTPALAQQEWSFEGDRLLVTNLVGDVVVRGHDGSRIIIRAQPGGDDAAQIRFEVKRGGNAEFHAVYPLAEHREYRYPRRGGSSQFRVESWADESSFLEDLYSDVSGRDRIKIGGDVGGDALEAWVDLEVLVPRDVASRVVLAVGDLEASGVQAAIDLDTHSGPVRAENIGGDTRIDTGSGSVEARAIRGNLNIDTGSGSVEAADVQGDEILIDTGSGKVTLTGASGREIKIDTGSGSVTLEGASARDVEIDTGSGSVRASEIEADNTTLDTGSGSVTLDLIRLSGGQHVIDTGSGGVTVMIPTDASVHVIAETGSGGFNLDVPDAQLRRMSRDHVEVEIGGGGARLEIETGSGSVTLRAR
ncbi:MAG: DUF4097 family beta strand repeat protein [Gemmatimonadota bacterium]|nr:MAG: DUF4097 family beta strand repeat protein [Gemmatimonadota bacterium]